MGEWTMKDFNDFFSIAYNYLDFTEYNKTDTLSEHQKKMSAVVLKAQHAFSKKICENDVSDEINLTWQEDDMLVESIQQRIEVEGGYRCPADILFAKTLPLTDVRIIVDERTKNIENTHGVICPFDIHIAENYAEIIDQMMEEHSAKLIGAGFTSIFDYKFLFPISIKYGDDYLYVSCLPYNINLMQKADIKLHEMGMSFISNFLSTWYALEVNMLNPLVQEVFQKPSIIKYTVKPKGGKQQKRKVIYKRKHIIKAEELEERMYGGDRRIHRKCLCWYVIGHWRKYKDGHKTFVEGFWKGVLRAAKRNLDEGRERKIPMK